MKIIVSVVILLSIVFTNSFADNMEFNYTIELENQRRVVNALGWFLEKTIAKVEAEYPSYTTGEVMEESIRRYLLSICRVYETKKAEEDIEVDIPDTLIQISP